MALLPMLRKKIRPFAGKKSTPLQELIPLSVVGNTVVSFKTLDHPTYNTEIQIKIDRYPDYGLDNPPGVIDDERYEYRTIVYNRHKLPDTLELGLSKQNNYFQVDRSVSHLHPLTASVIADLLNRKYGFDFVADDVSPISAAGNIYTIAATALSLGWIGQAMIEVGTEVLPSEFNPVVPSSQLGSTIIAGTPDLNPADFEDSELLQVSMQSTSDNYVLNVHFLKSDTTKKALAAIHIPEAGYDVITALAQNAPLEPVLKIQGSDLNGNPILQQLNAGQVATRLLKINGQSYLSVPVESTTGASTQTYTLDYDGNDVSYSSSSFVLTTTVSKAAPPKPSLVVPVNLTQSLFDAIKPVSFDGEFDPNVRYNVIGDENGYSISVNFPWSATPSKTLVAFEISQASMLSIAAYAADHPEAVLVDIADTASHPFTAAILASNIPKVNGKGYVIMEVNSSMQSPINYIATCDFDALGLEFESTQTNVSVNVTMDAEPLPSLITPRILDASQAIESSLVQDEDGIWKMAVKFGRNQTNPQFNFALGVKTSDVETFNSSVELANVGIITRLVQDGQGNIVKQDILTPNDLRPLWITPDNSTVSHFVDSIDSNAVGKTLSYQMVADFDASSRVYKSSTMLLEIQASVEDKFVCADKFNHLRLDVGDATEIEVFVDGEWITVPVAEGNAALAAKGLDLITIDDTLKVPQISCDGATSTTGCMDFDPDENLQYQLTIDGQVVMTGDATDIRYYFESNPDKFAIFNCEEV